MKKKHKKPKFEIKDGMVPVSVILEYLEYRNNNQEEPHDEYSSGYNDGVDEEFSKFREELQ